MSLMRQIRDLPILPGEVAVWFLGQNGVIFRTRDLSLGVDLYLSDSCASDEAITHAVGTPLHRSLPIFIPPGDLDLDLILATHEHKDHADPETLLGVQTPSTKFGGPGPVLKLMSDIGLPSDRFVDLREGRSITIGSTTIRAVFARHAEGSVGYVFEFAGLRIYMTGDSEFDKRLFAVKDFSPDLLMVCINGRWGNMSSEEALELARQLRPKVVIPTHYDMFAANRADPNVFADSVRRRGCGVRPLILEPGKPLLLSRATL